VAKIALRGLPETIAGNAVGVAVGVGVGVGVAVGVGAGVTVGVGVGVGGTGVSVGGSSAAVGSLFLQPATGIRTIITVAITAQRVDILLFLSHSPVKLRWKMCRLSYCRPMLTVTSPVLIP
jgi:hypothetical protein